LRSAPARHDVNARTLLQAARAVVPRMLTGGGGKIVNVGAFAAQKGAANMDAYVASKGAVIRLTETMAAEAARGEHQCQLRAADRHRHARESFRDAQIRSATLGGAGRSRQRDRVSCVAGGEGHPRRCRSGDGPQLAGRVTRS
jgi:NAD(P)-dependent dehydrogenase (short-subunit alcohol dehydrogenase family)